MPERQPHAVLDAASRNTKALKIERLLDLVNRPQPVRVLEIGTGSGGIAHYFANHDAMRCEVVAVDVVDNRRVSDGYEFHLVRGVALPFADANFDVVVSNHVIEHVGDAKAQVQHLSEIRRVMKHDGVGYLAVPNRWMLTEPHYRLMFLSWWPRGWRTLYLRLIRGDGFYDCEPLERHQLERMLEEAGLGYRNLCIEAMRETLAIERPEAMITRWLSMVSNQVLEPLRGVIPTLIYRLDRGIAGVSATKCVDK
jgi:SAM-dependent methyltransferase